MRNLKQFSAMLLTLVILVQPALAKNNNREIGAVSTNFKLIGPNHKIVITAFDDPKVKGVSCYVARPKTGGIKGALGLAEDPSIGSVSCVQTGPISYLKPIESDDNGEEVFDESRSLIFKSLEINRLFDKTNNSLVYVVRTTRIIQGDPTTSISVITPMIWDGIKPQPPKTND